MRKKTFTGFVAVLLVFALICGCNGKPETKTDTREESGDLVVAVYGDTRPKWWPFEKQETHYQIAKEISKSKPDAVLFTGDMVVFNMQDVPRVTITKEWDQYYGVVGEFFATKDEMKKPLFYPALGNHELLTWKLLLGVLDTDMLKQMLSREMLLDILQGTKTWNEVAELALGDLSNINPDKLSETRRDALKDLVVNNMNELYQRFNTDLPVEKRKEVSWNVMKGRIFPKHPYLKDIVNTGKEASWYYFDKKAGKENVRFVCLNSNVRGSEEQLEWFKETCEEFDGPIIVFSHHPIYSVGEHAGEKFTIDYRNEYKEPISKYATLYLCGHEHNYQRFSATDPEKGPLKGPVFIVTGGGGAPIRDNKESENEEGQFYPDGWDYKLKKQFNYVKLIFNETESGLTITVRAYGWKGSGKPEGDPKLIESFDILWEKTSEEE